MDADSAQKDWRPIQQNICTSGFDGAKPYVLHDPVGFTGNLNLVEPGILRGPKRQVRRKRNFRAASCICLENLCQSSFWNSNCDALLQFWSVKLDPAFDAVD